LRGLFFYTFALIFNVITAQMKVSLSSNGPSFSRIVAGVMSWGEWGRKFDQVETQSLIEKCLELGITTFDHADIYGHYTTESDWGKGYKLAAIDRARIEIVTKCGINLTTPNRPDYKIKSYNTSRQHILDSVDRSLNNLQTDYIDLLLIHRPDPLMNAAEVAEAFEQLKSSGKVLHFGVSNFTPSQYELLDSYTPLVTNQVEASLLHLDPIYDGTFDQCQQLQVRPMAWSPIGGGKVFGMEQEDVIAIRAKGSEICNRYDNTFQLDQLLLAWLMKLPCGILPVVGTTKIERLEKAVAATGISITNEEWYELLEVARGHEVA